MGKPYRQALKDGEITIESQEGKFWLRYFEKKFPIRQESYKELTANGTTDNRVIDKIVPDRNEEYHIYQTMIGALPFEKNKKTEFVDRIKRYFIKALREAKEHSIWAGPNTEYEQGCMDFIDEIMNSIQFLKDFEKFQKKIAFFGMFNSLSQTLVKITAWGAGFLPGL